ncbi:hypothetical protein ACTJKU_38895, partial [Citrobacter freundii]
QEIILVVQKSNRQQRRRSGITDLPEGVTVFRQNYIFSFHLLHSRCGIVLPVSGLPSSFFTGILFSSF